MAEEPRDAAELALKTETIKFRTAVVVGIAAIVGAVAGILPALHAASTAQSQADASNAQVQTLIQQKSSLQGQLAQAQASIAALHNDGQNTPTAGGQPTPVASNSGSPGIYHHDPLVLTSGGDSADLDADPSNHAWKVNTTDVELTYYSPDLEIETWSNGAVAMTGTPSYDACNHASGYSKASITITRLERTPFLCVITSENRLALVIIKSVNDSQLNLDVTVYAKNGD